MKWLKQKLKSLIHKCNKVAIGIARKIGKVLPYFIYRLIQAQLPKMRKVSKFAELFTDEQWLEYILSEIQKALARGMGGVVLFGREDISFKIQKSLFNKYYNKKMPRLYAINISIHGSDTKVLQDNRIKRIKKLSDVDEIPEQVMIVACSTSNFDVTKILQTVFTDNKFQNSEFIHLIRTSESYPSGSKYVSSLFDFGLIEEVYEFSLTKCEKKCQVADAYDLCQLAFQTKDTEGAIAEFGSYRGHSGLIICEFAKRLNIKKQIYLCDTFGNFPRENIGVDKLWSNTHELDFEKIKKLFQNYNNVRLIRGDFSETIDTIPEDKFSLVYVDCDSYRAVRLVSERIYPKLNSGSVIIYEDYGHVSCLGARYAVDEFYRNKKDCRCFFSGFSGLYIVMKL